MRNPRAIGPARVLALPCGVPYRIDLPDPPADALDRLVALGALDVETGPAGLSAIVPDSVDAARLAASMGETAVTVSPAVSRDDGSVWVLHPRAVRAGRLEIVPEGLAASGGDAVVQLLDGPAFGSGLHPTTALCLELVDALTTAQAPPSALDVGTGSGVLALAALRLGVPHVHALDVDADALAEAEANARLNGLHARLTLLAGGPGDVDGAWPLVMANILAAPLIDMAPVLVQRVAHRGVLLLSGVPADMAREVERVYRRLGLRPARIETRAGWSALVMEASW